MSKPFKSVCGYQDFQWWLMATLFAGVNIPFAIPEGDLKDAP